MNPLIYLACVGTASAGLVFWQQTSIDQVQKDIAQLSKEYARLLDANATSSGKLNRRLKGFQEAAPNEPVAEAALEPNLTPQKEGWWPKEKPYFYLPKSYLAKVKFRGCRLPIGEVNTILTKRAKALNPNITRVETGPDADGQSWIKYYLFESGKLSRDMSALLGMNEFELARTEELYAELDRAVRDIEVTQVQRVDPPEPDNYGRRVVARMPDLSKEVKPLLAQLNEDLEQLLGKERAQILAGHAENYFKNYADRLGLAPRDFIVYNDGTFLVRSNFRGESVPERYVGSPPQSRNEQYGHLFAPGAICELK